MRQSCFLTVDRRCERRDNTVHFRHASGHGDNAVSSHAVEFGLSPFPKESKKILFEPRLLIPLLSQKGEVTCLHDCHCQLQSPKFRCSETVAHFGSNKVPPSRMRTEPVPASLMQTSCTDVNGLFLKIFRQNFFF